MIQVLSNLDVIPAWCMGLLTMALVVLSIIAGQRFGARARNRARSEGEPSGGAESNSILGLLAFMLAFTFSMASSRFDTRRQLVLDEANAIGTAHLRAGMLRDGLATEVRPLLREYATVRLGAARDLAQLPSAIARSEAIHQRLWANARVAASEQPNEVVALFVQSLNDLINLHSKRVMAVLHNRIPPAIWGALFAVTIIAMSATGYQTGLNGRPRYFLLGLLTVAFSTVILLITDLDRPYKGLLRVSQQAMADVQKSMQAEAESR